MINPKCDICSKELEEMGAILTSPPQKLPFVAVEEVTFVRKFHICVECYKELIKRYF